jgi:alkyl hydroperoxide reductase subunit F
VDGPVQRIQKEAGRGPLCLGSASPGRARALAYTDRKSGEEHSLPIEGVFVQIGLVANTEWLRGSRVALSPYGEIGVDDRGRTSAPGVFAAGDATTVPTKQIVIAVGDGANAALGAFGSLIRAPVLPHSEAASS